MNELILGTAQFGLDYGVTNLNGRITGKNVQAILDYANENNIHFLDTAPNYGEASRVISGVKKPKFEIITKYEIKSNNLSKEEIRREIMANISLLGRERIHTILLHNPSPEITKTSSFRNFSFICNDMKSLGLVDKMGASIYSPTWLPGVLKVMDPDIIQAPFNIFDTRLIRSGMADLLVKKNIEIHVRSIFLQGVLLMENKKLPSYFSLWKDLFDNWNKVAPNFQDKLSHSIAFIKKYDFISKVLIGVSCLEDLRQIINEFNSNFKIDYDTKFDKFISDELIDPYKWKLN